MTSVASQPQTTTTVTATSAVTVTVTTEPASSTSAANAPYIVRTATSVSDTSASSYTGAVPNTNPINTCAVYTSIAEAGFSPRDAMDLTAGIIGASEAAGFGFIFEPIGGEAIGGIIGFFAGIYAGARIDNQFCS